MDVDCDVNLPWNVNFPLEFVYVIRLYEGRSKSYVAYSPDIEGHDECFWRFVNV